MLSKIYHVSDQHIRLFKRHKEYELVFKRLFKYIEETKDENSVIFLGGDLVHSKTDMSPEMFALASRFLKSCADLCPTILVAGNHDCNLSNSHRLDALTPIVNSLNHPNLYYWKDSGVYKLNGVHFSVFSVFGSVEDWVPAKDIKGKYKIALHHGAVNGATTDIGHKIENTFVGLDKFEGFDLGLLGDIHSLQFLNEEKTIAYSSSVIQQNFGEDPHNHGILVWDLKKRKAEFVPIKNDYGYFTFFINNGNGIIPNDLPKNLRVRIKHENSTSDQIHDFVKRIGKKYSIIELIQVKINGNSENLESPKTQLGNSREVEYQNELITEFLRQIEGVSEEEIDGIRHLNREINSILNTQSLIRNVTWVPLKFEFSNMFSYGEDNIVDFNGFNGCYGIFAQNQFGKSAFLDALTFCIYDKSTRASKASHILNSNKEWFQCKFTFSLNGKEYYIERKGKRNEKGNGIPVHVKFWTYDEDGEELLLNGEDRDQTNKIIRDYLGNYDDFVMTSLSTQYDNQSFVEKSQRERKDLLYKFLDISIYDELFRIAKENSKEFQTLIREFDKENLHEKSSLIYAEIGKCEKDLDWLKDRLHEIKSKIKDGLDEIISLNKQYMETDTKSLDLTLISTQILKENKELEQCIVEIKGLKKDEDIQLQRIAELESQIVDFVSSSRLISDHKELDDLIKSLSSTYSNLERDLLEAKKKIEHLQNHEYDPNCEFCVKNPWVKDALEVEKQIPLMEEKLLKLSEALIKKLELFKELDLQLTIQNKGLKIVDQIEVEKANLQRLRERQDLLKYKGRTIQEKIQKLQLQEQEYHKQEETIEKNKQILKRISEIKFQNNFLEQEEKKYQDNYNKSFGKLESNKKEYKLTQDKLNQYLVLVRKFRNYELYLQALSREGVPYKILEKVLPVIEYGVNEILNQVTNFTIKVEAQDDKYIHAHIVHPEGESYPVELTSGMERFIISLAFRTALNDITSLPKPNFLAIDEGFGVLDSENLSSLGRLFNYLKTQYDYLLCISHIDAMKDLVDKTINIEKIDGFSRINVR